MDEEEEEKEFIKIAEKIIPAMTSLPEQSTKIRGFLDDLHKNKPEIAKGLMAASLICNVAGAFCPPMIIVGMILGGVSSALGTSATNPGLKKNKKEKDLKKVHEDLTSIKERLTDLEKKNDKILNILGDLAYFSGMKKIRKQFELMLGYPNLELWAEEFHYNINQFSQNLADFEKENMTAIFKDIFENKCDDNLKRLDDIYEFVMTARLLYFQITTSHYINFVNINKDDKEKMLMKEISMFSKDMMNIADCMTNVCPFFHAYKRMTQDFQFYQGNSDCADCGRTGPEYASYTLGIFLCTRCASCHRHMGAQVSQIKHLYMDTWDEDQVAQMKEVGNIKSNLKYERWVPPSYRKVSQNTPQVLLEQFIFSKYIHQEFIHPERQSYTSGFMEGCLMKRRRYYDEYLSRKFVLSENTLKYYVNDRKDPKAIIISDINVEFSPDKIPFPNSLQIYYVENGSTRHIYVYHDDPRTIVNWYQAIRCCKLHFLQVANPSATDTELIQVLSQDFDREGLLYMTGSCPNDVYRKRWCSLQDRKLLYHDEVLAAYSKGEIFLGDISAGYNVVSGFEPGFQQSGYGFTLHTPVRAFQFSAETNLERTDWIQSIERVLKTPPKPQNIIVEAAGIAPVPDAELGDYAPIWVPDYRTTMCQKCSEDFTQFRRRHHCRACGQVVCYYCSSNQAPLKYTHYESKRVCDTCYDVLLKKPSRGLLSHMVEEVLNSK